MAGGRPASLTSSASTRARAPERRELRRVGDADARRPRFASGPIYEPTVSSSRAANSPLRQLDRGLQRQAPRSAARTEQRLLPHLLTIDQIAEHLGVTVRHVRRLVAERRIPYIKWGHLLRFDPDEIASWLDGVRVPPADGVARSR